MIVMNVQHKLEYVSENKRVNDKKTNYICGEQLLSTVEEIFKNRRHERRSSWHDGPLGSC